MDIFANGDSFIDAVTKFCASERYDNARNNIRLVVQKDLEEIFRQHGKRLVEPIKPEKVGVYAKTDLTLAERERLANPILPPERYLNCDHFVVMLTPLQIAGIIENIEGNGFNPMMDGQFKSILDDMGRKAALPFNYLKSYELDKQNLRKLGFRGNVCVRFHIDTERLLESRTIFADPEQMIPCNGVNEYGLTYMVVGGIPLNSIVSWELWDKDDSFYHDKLPLPNTKRPS